MENNGKKREYGLPSNNSQPGRGGERSETKNAPFIHVAEMKYQ